MQRDDRVGSQASRVTDGPFGIKIKDHPNGTVVTPVANPAHESWRFRGRLSVIDERPSARAIPG